MRRLILLMGATLACVAVTVSAVSAQNDIVLQLTVSDFLEDTLQTVVDEYETENPGIQVQLVVNKGFGMPVESSDDPEEYLDNLEGYFSSADVLIVDSDFTSVATRAGYALDLMPLTRSDPAFNEGDFQSTLLDSFEWDGGQWALPISASFVVVSYIPEAFDAAGLPYPTESWTLDDLAFAAQNLIEYDADGNVALPGLVVLGGGGGAANLPSLLLSLAGQSVYNDATFPNDPDFTSPALETLLDGWLQMETDGLLAIPSGVDNDLFPLTIDVQQGFGGGPGGGFGGGQGQNNPERATALLPGGRAGMTVNGYAVSSGTFYPDAAYDLVKYLISNSTVVNTSFGTVPALRAVDQSDANQGGPGGGFGPGAFGPGNFALTIPTELEPLIDVAIERAIPLSEGRFSDGIVTALNLMEDEGYDARTALDTVQSDLMTDLTAADARAATTQIAVQEPVLPRQLAAGEIALNFATLGGGGGGPGGGFALEQQWQATADGFADADPEVGLVTIGQENQNQLATVAETYDCFYADSNLVPDADLSLLLNLDPLLSTDPAFDPNDYISGVFDQVKVNNQTWALPLQISPLVLRIDYDIFRQAGVNPPQGSWTVSEFEDAIRNIQFALADDQTPVTLNVSGESAMLTLIAAYGGLPLDTRTDPPTVNFTDPATVNALQQVLDLVKNGYILYAAGGPGGGGFGGGGQNTASLAIYSNNLTALGFGGFGGPGGGGFGGGQNTNTDGIITFPLGTQFNAVPLELSAGYISAYTQHADACYRFLMYLSNATDLFQSMPARHSVINSQALMTAQGEQNVAFYNALADLIEQPTTIIVPDNIDAGTFGMTNWLFDVFDRYTAGEVVDLESDLRVAETTTRDYLTCVAAIPPIDFAQDGPQAFFQQIQACQDAVDPDV